MHPFRAAIEAGDLQAVEAMLSDQVVFHSPVAFKPYVGKPITFAILSEVFTVFEDFRYIREINANDGVDHALVFEAKVDGLQLTGCDFLRIDGDGKIVDLMVMVRPLRGAEALARVMGERFDKIKAHAQAYAAADH